jgi:TPR repeat protein
MTRWLAVLFLLALSSSLCVSQSISIDPIHSQSGRLLPHYSVGAANGDPNARTLDQIAGLNLRLAEQGNTEAAFELGLAYLQGYGVEQDLAKAEHWFMIGATDDDEKDIVAGLFRDGAYFERDLDKAAQWSGNRPGARFELARAYQTIDPPQLNKAIPIYLELLKSGGPEVRRAQMEFGNLVIDGKYSAGNDASGRAKNLEWARIITQELLGQEEYKIAVDYSIGREDLPADHAMWLHYCKRAAAYNIDLAQRFYAQDIMEGKSRNHTRYDEVVWLRLASQKQVGDRDVLKTLESGMSPAQVHTADDAFAGMVWTRKVNGAYYPAGDPLRGASTQALAKMPQDDADVQLREAFAMERVATMSKDQYLRAMDIYRKVRDRREIDVRMVLARDALNGTRGVAKNEGVARYWLFEAAQRGSAEAKDSLAKLEAAGSK